MFKDQDYVVKDDEVLIVDEFTGRIMPGRRYSDGLHQAIEAKEHVKVKRESKTLATITFQNFFNKFDKKAGMTGTALTEEKEFRDIYGMDVVEIPTNKPVARIDLQDAVYATKRKSSRQLWMRLKRHMKGTACSCRYNYHRDIRAFERHAQERGNSSHSIKCQVP